MIRYKAGILEKLKEAGYNSNRIRTEKLFGEKTLQDFRHQAEVPYKSIDRLCSILHCDVCDVLEYIPDPDLHDDKR